MRNLILSVFLAAASLFGQGITATPTILTPVAPTIVERTFTDLGGNAANITSLQLWLSSDGVSVSGPNVCSVTFQHYPDSGYIAVPTYVPAYTRHTFSLVGGAWVGPMEVITSGPCSIDLSKTSISYPNPSALKLKIFFQDTAGFTHGQWDASTANGFSLLGAYHQF